MTELERELLYRLLTANYNPGSEQKIYVGELPPDFPVTLPAGVRLLGSKEDKAPRIKTSTDAGRIYHHHLDHTRVLLDSDLPVSEFVAQMRAKLDDAWEAFNWPGMQQGFLPAADQDAFHVYHPALRQWLHVQAEETAGVTQVTLDLNSQESDPREQMQMHFAHQQRQLAVSVRMPAGTMVQPGGGGGSGNNWQSEAIIETTLSAAALLDFFDPQLQADGWQPLIRSQTDALQAASWANASGALVFITLSSAGPTYSATMLTFQLQHQDS
ncbi:hypothetical protein [Deinococcus sp.]|uniref:hypothetical protein n=1 Tax=Deinococcus sp. TaxID=47478 RepID=UPI003B5B4CEF